MMLAQFIGIVFGLAVAGAVFVNVAISSLHGILPATPRAEIQAIIGGRSHAFHFPTPRLIDNRHILGCTFRHVDRVT